MAKAKGELRTLVAFYSDGTSRVLRVDANGYLKTALAAGLTGDSVPDPKGILRTPVVFDPDDKPVALEVDDNNNLLTALMGGSAWDVLRSDGTDFEIDTLADVIKGAILTTAGDIMLVNGAGAVTRLPKPAVGQILGESGQIPAWVAKPSGGYDETASASSTTTQAALNNVWKVLALDTEEWDTNTMHDTVTNNSRITIKEAGVYSCFGALTFDNKTTGRRVFRIHKNGTTNLAYNSLAPVSWANQDLYFTFSQEAKLAVDDYIELGAYQDSGATIAILACRLQASKVAVG